MKILAKSNGITLLEHSIIVMIVGNYFAKKLFTKKELIEKATIACGLHDLGKCYHKFQEYIIKNNQPYELEGVDYSCKKKNKPTNVLLHNIISWAWVKENISFKYSKSDDILNPIIYHHPITCDLSGLTKTNILEEIGDETKKSINEQFKLINDFLKDHFGINKLKIKKDENESKQPDFYYVRKHNDVVGGINESCLAIKSCLIASDRFCSNEKNSMLLLSLFKNGELTDEKLDSIFNDKWNLSNPVELIAPDFFDKNRFNKQKEYAMEAINHKSNVTIIKAPAGFGKTITGLLWSTKLNKKTIWVCPINTIATSTYDSIIEELKTFNIDLKVELLLANEIKKSNFKNGEADVLVTNIDNFLRPTIHNDKAEKNYDLLNYNVIFDEFHELDSQSAIFAGFINIIRTRMHYCPNSKTLLLSATPEKLNNLWDTNEKYKTHIIKAEPLNNINGKYRLNFRDRLEVKSDISDSLYMFNSITFAQDFYLKNQDKFNYLIHSLFTENDKEDIRINISHAHGKHMKNSIPERSKHNVVGTRIIGTGLDISFGELHENVVSPELTLQSIGRINRYGEITDRVIDINLYRLDDNSENSAININYKKELSNMWYSFLKDNFTDGQVITLSELYEIYDKFYEDKDFLSEYNKIIRNEKLHKSKENYSVLIPQKYFNKCTGKSKIITIQKNSLRSTGKDVKFVLPYNENSDVIIEPIQLEVVRFGEHEDSFGDDKIRTNIIKRIQKDENYDLFNFDLKRFFATNKNIITKEKMLKLADNSNSPFILLGFEYDKNVGLRKIKF